MENFGLANCTKWKIYSANLCSNFYALYSEKTALSLFFYLYSLLSTEQPIGGTHAVDDIAIFGYGTRFAIHGYER